MQKLFLFLCVCFCVCMCVVSKFDLSITKQNYLFVRCQSLSHIPNTSLCCSNQPLWKLKLMTEVNTTKQQTEEIKNNIKSNLVELNKVRKQPQRCSGKKDVLINSCSESCQGKFQSKSLEISLKKFVFSKVAQSRSRKFLPKKETGEKHNFHKFLC